MTSVGTGNRARLPGCPAPRGRDMGAVLLPAGGLAAAARGGGRGRAGQLAS